MPRREIRGKTAIVTGASSGIGRAIALELARQGANLVLLARRESRLREVADVAAALRRASGAGAPQSNGPDASQSSGTGVSPAVVIAGDVTDPATRQKTLQAAVSQFGRLDILVNNAGVGALGHFDQADPARLRRIMEVNFFAPVELTRLALPLLKQAKDPVVVNVGSILGRLGVPGSTEYCASKFALRGFSEALRAELSREAIDVLLVSPATTRTEFLHSLVERRDSPDWRRDRWQVSAEYVARGTVRAIRRGDPEVIPSIWGKLVCLANWLFPRLVSRLMAQYAQ